MQAVLGINCFSHDTSACLLVDGDLVAFAEQERFNRRRHTKAFPDDAISYCLRVPGLDLRDVDVVAFGHRPAVDLARGVGDAFTRLAARRGAAQLWFDANLAGKELAFRRRWRYRGRVVHVGHHHAHAAAAFFASPFDDAAVLTVDRGGDFVSTMVLRGRGNELAPIAQVRNPNSLGEVYSAFTWLLGFEVNADEGKVMGLAPYGRDRLVPSLRPLIHLDDDGLYDVDLSWFDYPNERGWFAARFLDEFGPAREPESEISEHHEDLAFGVQAIVEDAALHVARFLRRRSVSPNLCLGGGLALNSVMNARLLRDAGFEHVFVQPAASDAGNALGAALWVWHECLHEPRRWVMRHAFFGPEYDDADYKHAVDAAGCIATLVDDPGRRAAELLADGNVVGWFQGRSEVGPRALGNRSILADPRRAEMKDIVNARVKGRESFRPFAPSVLHEAGSRYFADYYPNAFMLLVEDVLPSARRQIPAVTHVDGTARLQTVDERDNPLLHSLIKSFGEITGTPVVLNTSFNLRGEPIVQRPEEAIRDFARTEMDALFLGSYLIEKHKAPSASR
jgi:carbamoyltransferase